MFGAAIGWVTTLVLPGRVILSGGLPGSSLILSPVLSGMLMDAYGRWRASRGATRSKIATFWGGALFAFGMALVRFLLVR